MSDSKIIQVGGQQELPDGVCPEFSTVVPIQAQTPDGRIGLAGSLLVPQVCIREKCKKWWTCGYFNEVAAAQHAAEVEK